MQNLVENAMDKDVMKTILLLMLQWQIDRQAITLQSRRYDDPEFVDDLAYLVNALTNKVEDLRYRPRHRTVLHCGSKKRANFGGL